MGNIDERYITPEFLKQYFPNEQLELSKQAYFKLREEVNQKRGTSGQRRLSDFDLSQIICSYIREIIYFSEHPKNPTEFF